MFMHSLMILYLHHEINILLCFIKDVDHVTPLGAICLQNYMVAKISDAKCSFSFKLIKYGQKTLYMQAETESDMNRCLNFSNRELVLFWSRISVNYITMIILLQNSLFLMWLNFFLHWTKMFVMSVAYLSTQYRNGIMVQIYQHNLLRWWWFGVVSWKTS